MTLPAQPGANQAPTDGGRAASGRFRPGVPGNPTGAGGGRKWGLAARVRDLVGDDGQRLAQVFIDVLDDPHATTRDRMEAATWLADRG